MKTTRGIYINLLESDYSYKFNGMIFYFSSMFLLEKFKNNVITYINTETIKFKNKYKININLDCYFSISYYKQIEKRGFRIFDEITSTQVTPNVDFINQIISF